MKKRIISLLLTAAMLLSLVPMTAFADASGYTVEFNYGGQEYVLPGNSNIKLSEILHVLGLEGTVTEAVSSAPGLFNAEMDAAGDDWTVTALHAFASREALSITLDGVPHEILVTDTQDPVIFYEYDPNTKELVRQEVFDYYTLVDSNCTSLTLEAGQWYVIDGTVTLQSRVENRSSVGNPAKIILKNGCTLYAPYGIENGSRNSLHIYGQDKNGGNGQLIIHSETVSVPEGCAGIGGGSSPGENAQGCGYVEINGGILDIYGGKNAAGIGGGDNAADVSVTINAGDVTAHGGEKGAGIGTGYGSTADIQGKGKIIINGGTVEATGGKWGAGIGCGYYGYPNLVEINGGNVTANGGSDGGAGIGGGHNTSGVDTTITGGTVCAIGNNTASGIGLGLNGVVHRSLTITGEQVVIYSGPEMTEATLITADSYVRLRELYVWLSITENPAHEHTFSDEWSKDETNHWHAATCEHTDTTSGFAAHTWGTGDKANECTVCGYVKPDPAHEHTYSDKWSCDSNYHWHDSTCEHGGLTSGFGLHTFGEGVVDGNVTIYTCTECGCQKFVYNPAEDTEGEIVTGTTYTGISLTLGSDIAINFYMALSEEARQNGTMTFNIGGRIVSGVKAKYNETEKKYYFSTPLTALEMNETVIATFNYNGVDYIQEYSVAEYIEEIVGNENKYGKEVAALAKKIANYGHYAQTYLASIHKNVTIGDGGYATMDKFSEVDINVADAKIALENYKVTVTGTSDNLSLYGSTVYFDSATALNYYVTVKNGVKPTAAAVNTVTGKEKDVEIKLYKDNIYIVSVKDITATELADDIEVKINNEITLTGSVFAYCNSVVKAHSFDGASEKDNFAVNAMAAFYEYYKAAVDYAEDTVTFDNDTYCERIYQTVKHGEKVQRPDPDPMTYGFVFDGWYKDVERTIPWNFDTPITEDTTIYGKWISQEDYQKIVENAKFQVSNLRNNAISEIESLNLEDGKKQDFIAEVDKAQFEAFSLIENAKYTAEIQNIIVEATNKINEVLSDAEHAVEYTVSFDMMGHGEQVSSQKVKKGEYAELVVPEAEGYFFNGWFKDETFQDQWIFDTDTVNGDITLYANWCKIITVTFDMMGHGTQLGQLNAYEGSTFGAPIEPFDSSFKFEGWYKDRNFTEKWNFATEIVGDTDITLYAKWVAKQ